MWWMFAVPSKKNYNGSSTTQVFCPPLDIFVAIAPCSEILVITFLGTSGWWLVTGDNCTANTLAMLLSSLVLLTVTLEDILTLKMLS